MLLLATLQFLLVAWVVLYLLTNIIHREEVKPVHGPLRHMPFISVCIPARDEERGIGNCVRSLLSQNYPDFEVIVVDDQSTDGTLEILNRLAETDPRLKIIKGAPLPEGWYGKPHAMNQAVQVAKGDWYLFTDADPVFDPDALMTAMYTVQAKRVSALSLLPRAEFGSFWERAVQPLVFAFIGSKTRFKEVNDPESKESMGVGAFILMEKQAYRKTGGHEALRQTILEDIGLAKLAKEQGVPYHLADGKAVFSIRMYHSLKEIWMGWRKNMFLAIKRSVLFTIIYSLIFIAFCFTPYVMTAFLLAGDPHWLALGLSILSLGFSWMVQTGLCGDLGLPKYTILLFPVGVWLVVGLMFNSMIHILCTGTSQWRGRTYKNPTR